MAEKIKDKVENVKDKITETATKVGHKVGEKVEEAADWAKEKAHQVGHRVEEAGQKIDHKARETFGGNARGEAGSTADIREHMAVYGSCGAKLGKVDHVEGSTIKLTKNDSADGMHHRIPISWVDHVDTHVHLAKSCSEATAAWQPA